jgi:flagellar motor switch protein FliN/FliY
MSESQTPNLEDSATMVVDPPPAAGPTTAVVEPLALSPAGAQAETLLDGLELPVEVRLGRRVVTLEQALSLRIGEALPVGPEDDDAVTLFVQGRPYATGDLVVIDGRFAFRVRELIRHSGETP